MQMQSLREAIGDLEDRLWDIAYDSAEARLDQMMLAMAELSPDVQESRIKSMLDEREELRVEMDNRYDLDLDHPSMSTPPIEYCRIVTEIELLEDFIDFVDTEDFSEDEQSFDDMEDLSEDEQSNRTAIAMAFLEGLPIVPLRELADGDCNICMEPYVTGCGSNVVRLPCGHLFGSKCLSTWLSSGAATCPMCRAVVIKEQPNSQSAPPRPSRLAEWRGAADFLDYIDDLYSILEIEGENFPGQMVVIVDTAWGPEETGTARSIAQGIEELSFARMVLKMARLFFTAGERNAEAAAGLAALMGRLYENLREPMRMACCPALWTENGPPVSFLIDPAVVPFVEFALERLVQVEIEDCRRQILAE